MARAHLRLVAPGSASCADRAGSRRLCVARGAGGAREHTATPHGEDGVRGGLRGPDPAARPIDLGGPPRLAAPRAAVAMLLLVLVAPGALADNPRVNTQIFRPSPHAGDLFNTRSSDTEGAWRWRADALLSFGKNPLVFIDRTERHPNHEVIQDQLSVDLLASVRLFEWFSLGVAVPVFFVNEGQESGFIPVEPFPSMALGDARVSLKVGLVRRGEGADGFGLAVELPVGLPTGHRGAFVSDGLTFTPTAVMDLRLGRLLVAGNVGVHLRGRANLAFNTAVSHELVWRLGASVDVIPDLLTVFGEGYGASANYAVSNNTHVELLLGGRLAIGDSGLGLTLGGGRALTRGYGSTKFRVIAGLGYTSPAVRDRDGDGIPDHLDACPDDPEDFDGFEDEDGCPDPDNDRDGICDPWVAERGLLERYAHICRGVDLCPDEAEDFDGFEDEDGCPDPDNDGDGICDPWVAERGLLERYAHICRGVDQCPDDPEDFDGFEDEDGCPDPDNDGDGICDPWVAEHGLLERYAHICRGVDQCPNEPEDFDGFEDEDGCPDPDNDGDGIPDVDDPCPNDPTNTCGVAINPCEIVITDQVFFQYDRDVILPESFKILDAVASVLLSRDVIEKVQVEGHTDSDGPADYNLDLSQRRAESVVRYLVDKGVKVERLVAVGFGQSRPIATNRTAAGRAQNRRVQFIILEPPQEQCVEGR